MTKNKDYICGCILPTNVVDITMCYVDIRFVQNTTQTLIGDELKTTLASINVWLTLLYLHMYIQALVGPIRR